ncbi:HD domain-containing protein [Persephonella sp.]
MGKDTFLNEFSDITMLKLAAFFHDIGKPFTKKKKNKYLGHDEKGAEIFKKNISKELALGNRASKFISKLIKNHLSIIRLYFLYKNGNITSKDINFFWYENRDKVCHLFILTLSDVYGTSEDKYFFEKIKEFIIYLQSYYLDTYKKEIIEQPLLTGKEIMEILNIRPSPEIGKIKNKLIELQIEGKIKTKEEAIAFIKSVYNPST